MVAVVVLIRHVPAVGDAWHQARASGGWWLAALVVCEICSFAGYVEVFHRMLGGGRIDRTASWLITMAGVAATRLLAAGGVGGIALTSWALSRSGRAAGEVTVGVTSFLVALYAVFMLLLLLAAALVLAGAGLGDAPQGVALTGLLIGAGALVLLLPWHDRVPDRVTGLLGRLERVRSGGDLLRSGLLRGRAALADGRVVAGALVWWAFDIAALGLALHRFGAEVPVVVLVLAYCLGLFGNLLPIPGGFGGVEGGLIGVLVLCGFAVGPVVAGVLTYRFASLWLPTGIGIAAQAMLTARTRRWQASG